MAGGGGPSSPGKDSTPGKLAAMPGPQEQSRQGLQPRPEEGLMTREGLGQPRPGLFLSPLHSPSRMYLLRAGWLMLLEGPQECPLGNVQPGL